MQPAKQIIDLTHPEQWSCSGTPWTASWAPHRRTAFARQLHQWLAMVQGMIDVDARLNEIINYLLLRMRDLQANPEDTRILSNTEGQYKQLIADVVREARIDELQRARANAGGVQDYLEVRLAALKKTGP
jgi:hypothetical protein